MKGIVFTELLTLVEDQFGMEIADRVIVNADLKNGGAFTEVGTYDYGELLKLVVALSDEVNAPVPALVKAFGKHLYRVFTSKHNEQISQFKDVFEFVESVESFIHVHVRKLYPEAELPSFQYSHPDVNQLVVHYRSSRPFADACEGLLEQCIESFGEEISIARSDLSEDGTASDFKLTRQAAGALV